MGPLAACGYRVFALDLLGYGYSSKPAPSEEVPNTVYNFETWGEQLADFCIQVVGTHAFLVSNSVGGIAALQCAVAAPDCCRGVVLMNVSLRGLHITKQLPFMRPLVATFQRTLRTSSLGKAFFANIAQAILGGWQLFDMVFWRWHYVRKPEVLQKQAVRVRGNKGAV